MERWRDPNLEAAFGARRPERWGRLDDPDRGGGGGAGGGAGEGSFRGGTGGGLEVVRRSDNAGGGGGFVERPSCTPPPRTSGCAFNGSGLLIAFYHTPSPYAGMAAAEAPRSYADFLSHVQGWQLAPIVRLQRAMGGGSLDAALWDARSVLGRESHLEAEEEELIDEMGPSSTTASKAPSKKRGGLRGGSMQRGLASEAPRGFILLIDAIAAAEIDPVLAEQYLVAPRKGDTTPTTQSQSVICAHNAAVAKARGRHDLWRVWSVASCACRAHEPLAIAGSPGAFPLAAPLLSALILERLKQRDVQTVAVLSCIALRQSHNPLLLSDGTVLPLPRRKMLPTAHESSYRRCRRVYADVLRRWGLVVPLAELTKFGGSDSSSSGSSNGLASSPTASRRPSIASLPPPALSHQSSSCSNGLGPVEPSMPPLGEICLHVAKSGFNTRPKPQQQQQQALRTTAASTTHSSPSVTHESIAQTGTTVGGSSQHGGSQHGGSQHSGTQHGSSLFEQWLRATPARGSSGEAVGAAAAAAVSPQAMRRISSGSQHSAGGGFVAGCWYAGGQTSPTKSASPMKIHRVAASGSAEWEPRLFAAAGVGGSSVHGGAGPSVHGGIRCGSSSDALVVAMGESTTSLQAAATRKRERQPVGERTRCAVCRLPVRGLSWYCGRCGHGGHYECIQSWMETVKAGLADADDFAGHCPAACGCRCMFNEVEEELVCPPCGTTTNSSSGGVAKEGGASVKKASATAAAAPSARKADTKESSASANPPQPPAAAPSSASASTSSQNIALPMPLALSTAAERHQGLPRLPPRVPPRRKGRGERGRPRADGEQKAAGGPRTPPDGLGRLGPGGVGSVLGAAWAFTFRGRSAKGKAEYRVVRRKAA